MYFLQELFMICLLIIALTADAFIASLAYGVNKIEISTSAAATINAICSGLLGISLGMGHLLGQLLSPVLAKSLGTILLLVIGGIKLFDCALKRYLDAWEDKQKDIRFTLSRFRFVLHIYADPVAADQDRSRSLSIPESVFLAVAMSLDGMIAGVGTVFSPVGVLLATALSFPVGMVAVWGGCRLGKQLAGRVCDISWVSGFVFLLLAALRWC